ncbi:uncharacterized protein LOC125667375 [Ostrea edulis]|uniref:uncharacterized protein LOC125667375 n=1 Tax=Ostrea edulis TaxID=37623 RepID=UPI0024AF6CBF|nr:uncharacterized protein LOC125667375 [Ostrea edulis]
MADRQKRERSSPSGETPVQEFKRPLRKPWSLEEKDFLQTFVETAGGVPKTNTMRFWEKCAEELNTTFNSERTVTVAVRNKKLHRRSVLREPMF